MRKFLIVFAALALVVALTLPAMAAPKIKFKGDIRYRGFTLDNIIYNFDSIVRENTSTQHMDLRGRFRMDIDAKKDLYGRFWFEIGDEFIGQNSTRSGEPGFKNDNDIKEIEVKQMFIGFKLPWNKAFEFQIGAVPAYDLPKGILMGQDAAGLKGKWESGASKVIFWYYKDKESEYEASDRDYYGGIWFLEYFKGHRLNLTFNYANDRFGTLSGSPQAADDPDDENLPEEKSKDNFFWIGFGARGKAKQMYGLKYSIDVLYQGGETDLYDPTASDIDKEAWLVDLTIGGKAGPVYLEFFWSYATGDDNPDDNKAKNYNNIEGGKENFRRLHIVTGYKGFDGGTYSTGNGDFVPPEYNGVNIYGLKGVWKATPKVKLTGLIAGVNTHKGADSLLSTADYTFTNEKDVGTELDLVVDYKIYKKLNLRGIFAYMWHGDYFKFTDEATGDRKSVV